MQPEHLIRSVLPVILLIIFGFWLQKRHYFSEETVQGVTKLVSDYLIPCTIFTTYYNKLGQESRTASPAFFPSLA